MNKNQLTTDDYANLDAAFTALRKEHIGNENNLIAIINLKIKIVKNLQAYDKSLEDIKSVEAS